jgi:hypothetical protein
MEEGDEFVRTEFEDCADRCTIHLRGVEYPLRGPALQPLYLTGRTAAEALDMLDIYQDTRVQP